MADQNSPEVDLLGDPWRDPKDARGRKRHKRIPEVAEKIAVLRATGSTVEEISAAIHLSEPTLRKYYFRELDKGPELAQAALDGIMWKRAQSGIVGAARYMAERFEKGKAAVPVAKPAPQPRAASGDDDAAAEKLGKKAAADRDAQTAHEGTGWGTLLKH